MMILFGLFMTLMLFGVLIPIWLDYKDGKENKVECLEV